MTDKKKISLQDQIKKRKTQEILRTIEEQKVKRATGELPAVKQASQTATVTGASPQPCAQSGNTSPKRTTQPVPASITARQTQQIAAVGSLQNGLASRFSRRQRQQLIASIAGLMLLAICGMVTWAASNQPLQANVPTYQALPTANAEQVVDYLKQVGLRIRNVAKLDTPDKPWHAQQQIDFDADIGTANGHFTLLSYDARSAQSLD